MRDRFWRWVASANARWVPAGSFVVAVVLVLAWALTRQAVPEPRAAGDGQPVLPAQTPAEPAPLPGREPTALAEKPETPFSSVYLDGFLAERERLRRAEAEAAAMHRTNTTVNPGTATKAVPPVRQRITLLYRGMLTRTDGVSVGLVQIVGSGPAAAYKQGETLAAFKVIEVTEDAAALVSADEVKHVLAVGEPVTLEY